MTLFLRVIDGRLPPSTFRLDEPCRLRVGRRHDSDIPLLDRSVSRQHCLLDVEDGHVLVTDTQSRNGIWVNDTRLGEPVTVGPGTVLRMAGARIEVQTDPGIDAKSYENYFSARRLISFLPGRGSNRKLRLLACAWYRQVIGFFPDEHRERLIEAAEEHADGLIDSEEMSQLRNDLLNWLTHYGEGQWFDEGPAQLTTPSAREAAESLLRSLDVLSGIEGVSDTLASLARDVLGDFFHPFQPAREWLEWNDETVRRMAQIIYESRDFVAMPILADALEDAGCDDEFVLRHCRAEQQHVRGCWILDSLLKTHQPRTLEPGLEATLTPR
jgi:hypothetical protein